MLAGFPLLKELNCRGGERLTGNINSLRLLKDTLEQIDLADCPQVGGNFMDLDFPHLKILDVHYNMDSITGDIRDMGEASFPKLEKLHLPKSVYGGNRSEIMRISDAKDLIATIYSIKKQRHRHPSLFEDFSWYLSESSPDSYQDDPQNQFLFCIVRAGSRLGWRWEQQLCDRYLHFRFEVNWLDPLPANGSNEYQSYIEGLQEIESYMDTFPFFRGYHEPPSEAVYYQLTREYRPSPSQEEAERREVIRVFHDKIWDAYRRKREYTR